MTRVEAVEASRGVTARGLLAAAALLGLGALGIVGSLQMGIGSLEQPGLGLWPLIVSVTLVLLTVVAAAERAFETDERIDLADVPVVVAVVAIVAFIVLFEYLGIYLCSVLFLAVWLRVVQGATLLFSALVALAVSVALLAPLGIAFRDTLPFWPGVM